MRAALYVATEAAAGMSASTPVISSMEPTTMSMVGSKGVPDVTLRLGIFQADTTSGEVGGSLRHPRIKIQLAPGGHPTHPTPHTFTQHTPEPTHPHLPMPNFALYAVPDDASDWDGTMKALRAAAGISGTIESAHCTVVYGPSWSGEGPEVPSRETVVSCVYPVLSRTHDVHTDGFSYTATVVDVDVFDRVKFFVVKVRLEPDARLASLRTSLVRDSAEITASLKASKEAFPQDPSFDVDDVHNWCHMTIAVVDTSDKAEQLVDAAKSAIAKGRQVTFSKLCAVSPVSDTYVWL